MKLAISTILILLLISCSSSKNVQKTPLRDNSSFRITEISQDETYGYSPKNPIEVGGAAKREGALNERRFLNSLAGPNGEAVSYHRAGSCCPIKSKNDPFGFGSVMLDNYRVTWEGSKDTVSIYINMYDYGTLKAPAGFSIKGK